MMFHYWTIIGREIWIEVTRKAQEHPPPKKKKKHWVDKIAILFSTERKGPWMSLISACHLNLVPTAMGFHASMDPLIQIILTSIINKNVRWPQTNSTIIMDKPFANSTRSSLINCQLLQEQILHSIFFVHFPVFFFISVHFPNYHKSQSVQQHWKYICFCEAYTKYLQGSKGILT